MCGCNTRQAEFTTSVQELNTIVLRVEDMTCGHCAGRITKAIESAIVGARVSADPSTRLVKVSGAGELSKVQTLIVQSGYTPTLPLPA
jgi:copper chaperone